MLKDYRITLLNFIKTMIVVLCFAGICLIWNSHLLSNTETSSSIGENNRKTGSISTELMVTQYFVPTHTELASISAALCLRDGAVQDGEVVLWLFDSKGTFIANSVLPVPSMGDGSYSEFPLNCTLVAGEQYGYTFFYQNGSSEGPSVYYRKMSTAGPQENVRLLEQDIEIPDGSVAGIYTYQLPLRVSQKLVYTLFIVLIGVILSAFMNLLFEKRKCNISFHADRLIRVFSMVAVLLGMTAGYYLTLIRNTFGGAALDHIAYGIGITLLGAYLLLAIAKTNLILPPWKGDGKEKTIRTILQVLSIGFYLVMYVYYYNSGLTYGHNLGISYMNAAFGLFMLTLFSNKELFSKLSLGYTILYWMVCGGWMLTHHYDADTTALYYVAIFVGWFWGIVILRTIVNLIQKKVRRFSPFFACLLACFFVLILVFRNTRIWPIYLVIFFTLFYLQKIDDEKMDWILNNLCRGVMASFVFLVFESWLYRPYHKYAYSRYPGPFAGVAVWGTYLALVFGVIFVKLLSEYRKDSSFSHNWFNYFTLALCNAYVFFSVSRTAFLSIAVVVFGASIIAITVVFRKKVLQYFKLLGMVLLVTLCLFPGIYTLTRTIPAIVRTPHINIYEEYKNASIYAEDTPDSEKYMNFKKMLETCMDRFVLTLFGSGTVQTEYVDENGNTQSLTQEEANQIGNLAYQDKMSGRGEIYQAYIHNLNLTGHNVMYLESTYETYSHAHNIYLQCAYDHGIITGIIFLLVGFTAVIRAFFYVKNKSGVCLFTFVPLVVIISFGVTGLTEWIFHPAIPITFAMMFVIAPLLSPVKRAQLGGSEHDA